MRYTCARARAQAKWQCTRNAHRSLTMIRTWCGIAPDGQTQQILVNQNILLKKSRLTICEDEAF